MKDAEDFRDAHDPTRNAMKKVQTGLKALGRHWEYHTPFAKRCGISATMLARCQPHFDSHTFMVRVGSNMKRVWCGTVGFAKKLHG